MNTDGTRLPDAKSMPNVVPTSGDVRTPITVGFCSQLIRVHRCSSVVFQRMATILGGGRVGELLLPNCILAFGRASPFVPRTSGFFRSSVPSAFGLPSPLGEGRRAFPI